LNDSAYISELFLRSYIILHVRAELQDVAASIFGKEAALFVVSGTMGNLISMMCHCWERGCKALLGDQSHIYKYEQGGVAQVSKMFILWYTLRHKKLYKVKTRV